MVLCIACEWACAQATLPREADKVVFYEVVPADSLSKEVLYQNARNWLIAKQLELRNDSLVSESHKLIATGQFPVYATGYVTKRQNGVVTYQLQIEVKEHKYRYRFSDFRFHYYQENRNYQLVATGKTKPLEDAKAPGWQKSWESTQRNTSIIITNLITDLKAAILQRPATEKTAKIQPKDW